MNSCKDCTHKQMCMWKRFIEEAEKGVEESMDGIKEKYPEFPVKLDLISTCSFYSSPKKDLEPLHCQVQNVPIPNLVIASSLQSSYNPYMPCCENTEATLKEGFQNLYNNIMMNKGESK